MSSRPPLRQPLMELPLERFVESSSSSASSSLTPKPIPHGQSPLKVFASHSRTSSSESSSWLSPSKRKLVLPSTFKSPEGLGGLGPTWTTPISDSSGGSTPRASPLRRSFAASEDGEPPRGTRFASLGRVLYPDDDAQPSCNVASTPDPTYSPAPIPIPTTHLPSSPLAPSPNISSVSPRLLPRAISKIAQGNSTPDVLAIITYSSNPNIPNAPLSSKQRPRAPSPSSRHYPGFDIAPDLPQLLTTSKLSNSESDCDEDEDKENALSLPLRRPKGSKRKMEPIAAGISALAGEVEMDGTPRKYGPGGTTFTSP
ncbi:uncharacterized protein EI90DRAFT_3117819 [Cantharellus anzutake]|uniref:uncharacterized protein n=1 Tax=Cantharellus anzutake TaxID=1750568 RepID=UPI001907EA8D|nr:uncharacterized protein EI90DRAFT_3117819 [Cantharellus anzutake]KAF8338729.1 hypothetical protein EI90DRAFT_3117819 [Cantharellus anzutake]